MTIERLKSALKNLNISFTEERLQEFAQLYDYEEIKNVELSKLSYEIWDKQSPINNVPASYFLSRPDFANAKNVYLIKYEDNVLYVQPHHPKLQGFVPIEDDEVEEIATQHINEIAERLAFEKYLDLAIQYLKS